LYILLSDEGVAIISRWTGITDPSAQLTIVGGSATASVLGYRLLRKVILIGDAIKETNPSHRNWLAEQAGFQRGWPQLEAAIENADIRLSKLRFRSFGLLSIPSALTLYIIVKPIYVGLRNKFSRYSKPNK